MNALASTLTAVGASGSRSQERMLRSGILWNWLHSPRSNATAQRNDGVAGSKRRPLQVNRIHSYLEQLVRVGRRVRFHLA
jgi:hypothetical protein